MTAVAPSHRSRIPLWWAVVAGGVITSVSLGVRSTFGLLIDPIAEGTASDLGTISLAIAIQNLLWGLSQPVAGAISDRYGTARTLAGGGVLYAVALVLMSTADSAGMVILSGGVIGGIAIGAASFAVVLSAVGRMAPPEKRSLMLGIVSAVGSLGQFVLIPITRVLLDNSSWERTTLVLAMVALLVVIAAPAMRSAPIVVDPATKEPDRLLRAELRRAMHSRSYLMLNAAFFVCGFHVTFIGLHLSGYVEDIGLSSSVGSTALALIGLFNVFGSLIAGALGQRFKYTWILAAIYGMRAVVIAAFILIPASSTATLIFGAAIGILWLATVPMTSGIVTNQFGPTHAGTLFGIVFLSHQIGSFIGAWMGGVLVDATGSYNLMWWFSVALGVLAMGLHLLISDHPVPEPPPAGAGGLRVAPAGLAMLAIVAIGSATLSLTARTADASVAVAYCVLSAPG
jgi:predicted MFS family arabinose efflux permease